MSDPNCNDHTKWYITRHFAGSQRIDLYGVGNETNSYRKVVLERTGDLTVFKGTLFTELPFLVVSKSLLVVVAKDRQAYLTEVGYYQPRGTIAHRDATFSTNSASGFCWEIQ